MTLILTLSVQVGRACKDTTVMRFSKSFFMILVTGLFYALVATSEYNMGILPSEPAIWNFPGSTITILEKQL